MTYVFRLSLRNTEDMFLNDMKILLVDHQYGYGGRSGSSNRYSSSYYLEYKPLKDLAEKHGHSVDMFFFDESIRRYGREKARAKFWELISQEKPDICIIYGVEYDIGVDLFKKLRDQNFTKMVYSCGDDAWSWDIVSRHFAKYFSWVITYNFASVKRYKRIGCEDVIYIECGVGLDTFKKLDREKDIDVSFVGLWTKPRARIIDYVKASGIDVLTRGADWPGGSATQGEMIDIINRTKVNLSLVTPPFYIGWRPIIRLFFRRAHLGESGLPVKLDILNFFDNIRSLLRKRTPNLKVRQFEVPACGAFQITQDAEDLRSCYVFGKEVVIYKNKRDLVRKIRYYLDHPKEREEIAQRGYERTLRDHDAKKRFEKIFAAIGYPIVPVTGEGDS